MSKVSLKFILLSLGLVLFLAILLWVDFNVTPRKPASNMTPSISPTQPPTILNQAEKNYPETTFQLPPQTNTQGRGMLVVTSTVSNTRVIIDPPDEDGSGRFANPSVKITPFKISGIPAGQHNLTAYRGGYIYYSASFTILPGQITRVNIELKPLDSRVGL